MYRVIQIKIPVEYLEAFYWITDVKNQGLQSCAHRDMRKLSGDSVFINCIENQKEKQILFYKECYEL
jgi:hypothetical protein